MAGNSFGKHFVLHTFGESHGPAIGGIIDGCPAGFQLDIEAIQAELDRRKPGQSAISSPRKEGDQVEILSGVFEGKTLGTPIGFIIRNTDQRPRDYAEMADKYRPGHADYTTEHKYGIRDYRGGGRSSARETASRVVAGALAKQLLADLNIQVTAWVSRVGQVELNKTHKELDLTSIDSNMVRCPDDSVAQKMIDAIQSAKEEKDSLGGAIACVISGAPIGLGEPVFEKLPALMAQAMMSINAVKAFEMGSGLAGTKMKGSENNDELVNQDGSVQFKTNHAGGVLGGISNGDDITFTTSFKPVSTIGKSQQTVNQDGEESSIEGKGRHDPCVVPRAIPIVESMAALVILDCMLSDRRIRWSEIKG